MKHRPHIVAFAITALMAVSGIVTATATPAEVITSPRTDAQGPMAASMWTAST